MGGGTVGEFQYYSCMLLQNVYSLKSSQIFISQSHICFIDSIFISESKQQEGTAILSDETVIKPQYITHCWRRMMYAWELYVLHSLYETL